MSDCAQIHEKDHARGASLGNWVLVIFASLTAFRIWHMTLLPLSGDEAYHWEWSRHLALGYYDHPPLTAYVIRLFTGIFGTTVLGVRFGALLLTSSATLLLYFLGRKIFSEEAGFYAFLLGCICPAFLIQSFIMSTDPTYFGFFVLGFYFLYSALFESKNYAWYVAGFFFGLSLLGKFLAVFFGPGLFLFLVVSRKHRSWLFRKEPYLMGIIALMFLTPVIYWNATHDWATFAFNFSKRHSHLELNLLYLLEYFTGETLIGSAFIYWPLLYLWYKFVTKPGLWDEKEKFLLSFSIVPILAFLPFSLIMRVGWHWPVVAYFPGIIILAGYFLKAGGRGKRYLRIAVIVTAIFNFIVYFISLRPDLVPEIHVTFKERPGEDSSRKSWGFEHPGRAIRKYLAKQQMDTKFLAEYYGWKELGEALDRQLAGFPAGTFALSRPYTVCAMTSFYSPRHTFVYLFGKPSVYGQNYLYWVDWEQMKGKDGLYISTSPIHGSEKEALRKAFQEVTLARELPIQNRGKEVRRFYFYLCKNLISYSYPQ